jgi:hypothetical protein
VVIGVGTAEAADLGPSGASGSIRWDKQYSGGEGPLMIRAILIITVLLAAVGSARSADLPFTSSERSGKVPGKVPQSSSTAARKTLHKSRVVVGKSKAIRPRKVVMALPPNRVISPTEHSATARTSASTSAVARETDWKTYVDKYMSEVVSLAVNAPEVIAAVAEQNAANTGLTPDRIEGLDRQWRAERKVNGGPLSNAKMFNPSSEYLKGFKTAANGPILEIFIMDNKGLNVAQTDPTSDYMQGDEDKWQKTFGAGPWMSFVDKPEVADGKRTVQVSTTLVDNDEAIGAMTVTLDLEKVPMNAR